MARKITVIGGSGFVGTNLCRQLSLKQQDFEIIDLKINNQLPDNFMSAEDIGVNIDSLLSNTLISARKQTNSPLTERNMSG